MMQLFLCVLLATLALNCASPNTKTVSVEQQEHCLTIENFNAMASFIEKYGEQISMSERLLSDKESLALEVSIGSRFIQLENYQDHKIIIIIDNKGADKITPYFLSNENNELQISAYYSRFDTDEDSRIRAKDWCAIVAELTKK